MVTTSFRRAGGLTADRRPAVAVEPPPDATCDARPRDCRSGRYVVRVVRLFIAAILGATALALVVWGGYSISVSDRPQVEGGGYGVVLIGAGLVGVVGADGGESAESDTPQPANGWVTYAEAVARRVPWVEPSPRPPDGVRLCTREELNLDYRGLSPGEVPPDAGDVCFARPQETGAVVPGTDPDAVNWPIDPRPR